MTDLQTEIRHTEQAFARMVKAEGIAKAFHFYAAENAVLNRQGSLIKGSEAILKFYQNWPYQHVKLEWEPEFIDVSAAGDMAYTYGPYTFSATDAAGATTESKGIFHTVWKKQPDGNWRYVWD